MSGFVSNLFQFLPARRHTVRLGGGGLECRLFSPPTRPAHRLLAGVCTFVWRGKGAKFYETRTARTENPSSRSP